MPNRNIAKTLIELKAADLKLRSELLQSGELEKGYSQQMENLHNSNAKALEEIIAVIGYPTIDNVGKEASEAAWLIIQHAIGQPDFMKKCLKLLEVAVGKNQADPKNLAYLSDRVAVFEGNPQLYGTQFDWDINGILQPQAYDALAKVNHRRKSIGLNTLEEQTAKMRKQMMQENQSAPKNFIQRQREMEAWRKKVGWIK